ncbi:MAG: TonB-dependent receptor [Bacteroidota bacterium]
MFIFLIRGIMHRHSLLTILFLLSVLISKAQYTQRIEGKVIDKESKIALEGVTIIISDLPSTFGSVTDGNGKFTISNVPAGKHPIVAQYIGYQATTLHDVLVTSAKEVVLTIEMEESAISMKEVTVAAKKEHINEMALVSAKTFDVQETERYAGSRADPARMASNFAGVQGGDDSRNDIIIRGNSPQGLLWRLEGIDIPSPNHFSIPGTTGGPVSMLNNKTLGNSDFFTGAFPAEYGNATAGVFDLKLRNGNNDRYEFTGQLGFLGTELAAEGPISRKNGSSFLFTYRYSTLQLFQGMNIKIGTTSIPNYQDATFKLNFPIGKKANISFFGIGGLSNIDLIVSKLTQSTTQLYGESDRDQYFYSNTGIIGASWNYTINPKTYTQLTVGITGNDIGAHHNMVFRDTVSYAVDSLKNILGYKFNTSITVAHGYLNKKLSQKQTLKLGLVNSYYQVNLIDSSRQYPPTRQDWQTRLNYIGATDLVQAYLQYKYRPSDNITFTAGLHGQYLTHNQSKSVEPRLAMRWRISSNGALSLGYGLHSEMQPLYQYFAQLPGATTSTMQNYNIDFTRSHHLVLGYEKTFSRIFHIRLESYYQYLFNIPIEKRAGSSYSGLNQGSSFSREFPDTLQNAGVGYNYGVELTVERAFSKGFYVLFTGSVFDSKAKGNDGVYRNTDYNSHFLVNLLAGYEKKVGTNSTLIAGAKITYAGGKLYSPADVPESNMKGDYVVIDNQRNTLQFPDYFRMDLKFGVRINSKKLTHEIAIDLVNILGTKNVLSKTYSSYLAAKVGNTDPFYTQYQLGFLPLFYYKVDLGISSKKTQ